MKPGYRHGNTGKPRARNTLSAIRDGWRERLVYALRFLQLRMKLQPAQTFQDYTDNIEWAHELERLEVQVYDARDGLQLARLARQAWESVCRYHGVYITYYDNAGAWAGVWRVNDTDIPF